MESYSSSHIVDARRNRRALAADAATYQLETFNKNAMIVFNQNKVLNWKPRHGSKKDTARITQTFEKFGFEVNNHLDLTKARIFEELGKCKCVVVVAPKIKTIIN